MTYKTILVHVGPDPEAENRLRTAQTLGKLFDATIMGVGAIAWDPYVDPALGYVDGATIETLRIDPVELSDVGGLRLNVWVSMVVFGVAAGYFLWSRRSGAGREQEVYRDGHEHNGIAAG